MNSKIHPKHKTRYQVTNWAEYDRSLVQRSNITVWISLEAIKAWAAKPRRRRGAPRKYSDLAIETALTLRGVFRPPLRQTEGFLRSILALINLSFDAPDDTTLSRRSAKLCDSLGVVQPKGPMHSIIDSSGDDAKTGIKVIKKTKGK